MSKIAGFTVPGGPVKTKELLEAWMSVYLGINLARSTNPQKNEKLSKAKDLLAEANEYIMDVLSEESE